MTHLQWPVMLAAVLAGLGVYGVIARRNAVLVLIGVELILNAANLLLVTAGVRPDAPLAAGPVVTLFVITIAAAEISIALAVILVMFRRFGHIDLTAVPDLAQQPESMYSRGPGAARIHRIGGGGGGGGGNGGGGGGGGGGGNSAEVGEE